MTAFGVAIAAAGAAFSFISQDVADAISALLAVGVLIAVVAAWVRIGSMFAARLIALSDGMVWFFLLIHGGLGVVFGPAGWIASAIGERAPRLAAALLTVPAVFLLASWLPIVLSPEGLDFRTGLAVVSLIVPAIVAAGVLFSAPRREGESNLDDQHPPVVGPGSHRSD